MEEYLIYLIDLSLGITVFKISLTKKECVFLIDVEHVNKSTEEPVKLFYYRSIRKLWKFLIQRYVAVFPWEPLPPEHRVVRRTSRHTLDFDENEKRTKFNLTCDMNSLKTLKWFRQILFWNRVLQRAHAVSIPSNCLLQSIGPDVTQPESVLRKASVQAAGNYKGSLHLIRDFEPTPISVSSWS